MTNEADATKLIATAAKDGTDAIARANHGPMGGNPNQNNGSTQEPNAVIEHLLLHRSLTDHDPDRLTEFLDLARNEVANFRNPFDRAIALTFRLVLDEQLDPWSIDLATFSTLYAERVRDTPHVDLITAGRLLAMAWNVLLAQTDALLARAEPQDEDPHDDDPWGEGLWDDLPGDWNEPIEHDTDQQYTQHVLDDTNDPPISESVFHQGDRRVTLYELVEALEEGRRDAERRKRINEERRKAREQRAQENEDEDVTEEVHEEDMEAEIHDVRTRLRKLETGEPTALHGVHDGTRNDFLSVFVSSLFLSRARMIDVEQEAFPHSAILITPRDRLHDDDAPLVGLPDADADFDERAQEEDNAQEATPDA